MKSLQIKDAKVAIDGKETLRPDGTDLTVKSLLEDVLNNRPQAGFSLTEMGARLKVLGKIKETEGFTFIFEDAEASKLQECTRNMNWAFLHDDIIELCKAIETMKPISAKKAKVEEKVAAVEEAVE